MLKIHMYTCSSSYRIFHDFVLYIHSYLVYSEDHAFEFQGNGFSFKSIYNDKQTWSCWLPYFLHNFVTYKHHFQYVWGSIGCQYLYYNNIIT